MAYLILMSIKGMMCGDEIEVGDPVMNPKQQANMVSHFLG
jgi:hypothetical protein